MSTTGRQGSTRVRTAWLLCFLPETLFECALVLWDVLTVVFWTVVLCEYAVAFAVEDEEGVDAVEGQVHRGW